MSIETLSQRSPNIITFSRLAVTPLIFLLHALHPYKHCVTILIIFIVLSITDFLDGYLARRLNVVSEIGRCFDIIADKVLVTAIALILVDLKAVPFVIVNLMLFRELIVAGLREYTSGKGLVIKANNFGKLKTAFQMISLPVLYVVTVVKSVSTNSEASSSIGFLAKLADLLGGCQLLYNAAIILLTISLVLSYYSTLSYLTQSVKGIREYTKKSKK